MCIKDVETVIPLQFAERPGRKCYGILNCKESILTSGRVIVHCFGRRDVDERNAIVNHGPELRPA